MTHLVANLGRVDVDLGSSPAWCSYLLPKQDGETSQIKVNPTQVRHQMCHPVLHMEMLDENSQQIQNMLLKFLKAKAEEHPCCCSAAPLLLCFFRRWCLPDIFVLKHESSIFRSFIQPCVWIWKSQASSPEAKQYRV